MVEAYVLPEDVNVFLVVVTVFYEPVVVVPEAVKVTFLTEDVEGDTVPIVADSEVAEAASRSPTSSRCLGPVFPKRH